MKINDANFIKELKRKNEDALEYVLTNYGRLLKSITNRILNDYPEDAEESLYDTIYKIWEHIDTYDETVPFKGWVAAIAKHDALNRLKKIKKLEPMTDIDELFIADESCLTGDALFDEVFLELISCLNQEDKIIFTKIFWYGESIDDVSKYMGISRNITYNRISRGRKKIIQHNPKLFIGGNKK